ncbi:MAG: hypothetical protein ACK5MT_18255 [Actinomycetales bacterium]
MSGVLSVEVGATLWFEGQRWTVSELDRGTVVLTAAGQLRRVRTIDLLDRAGQDPSDDDAAARDPNAVLLAGLTTKQRAEAERRAAIIRELLDEPPGDEPIHQRYQAASTRLGVNTRNVYRLVARYQEQGVAGLVHHRLLQQTRASIDPAWDTACRATLASYRDLSNPTLKKVIAETNALFLQANPDGAVPSQASAYRRVRELDKGNYTFGVAKQRRSVAARPGGPLGRLRASRPGEYLVLDTTRLDVFAMEPVTLRWVNVELTVAMDLFSRCITGLTLRPIAAKAADAASVLHQTLAPQQWGDGAAGPAVGVPDTIVVDHGRIYLSQHVLGVCDRLGINVQPAIPYKPTDKPTVERFFRTLRQSLLEHLPAYKGPDVAARGLDVEAQAFLYVDELAQVLREWVGIYHRTPHAALCDPHLPHVELSPADMLARGVAMAGQIRLPAGRDTAVEFLDVAWRTIQHYGVEIRGRRYDGSALNPWRGVRSTFGGAHPGKWPFMVDADDIRWVWFQAPDTQTWHRLEWEHASGLRAPFSQDAAEYTRRISLDRNRHVDPDHAIADLLTTWSRDEVISRRDQNLARRLAAQRAADLPHPDAPTDADSADPSRQASGRELASTPGVVDLLARLERRTAEPVGDDLDVFARYYAEHPAGGFEVFDE